MSLSNIENRTNSLNSQVQSYIISRNEILYTDNVYANNVSSNNDLNLNFAQVYQSNLNDVNINVLGGINTATEIHSDIESSEFQNTIMHKVKLSDFVLNNPKFDNLSLNGANIKQINDARLHDITIRNSNLNIETDVNLNSLTGNNFFINNSFIENINANSFGKLENVNIGTIAFSPNITASVNSANVENMFVIHNLIAEDFESNSFDVSNNLIIENLTSQNVNMNIQDGIIFTRFDGKAMTDKSAALGSNFEEMVNGGFAYDYFNNLSLSWNPDSTIGDVKNLQNNIINNINSTSIIANIQNDSNNTIENINNEYRNQLSDLNSYINNQIIEANNVIGIGKQDASNIMTNAEERFSNPPDSPVYGNLNNTCEISLKNMVNYPIAELSEGMTIDQFIYNEDFDYFDIAYNHNIPNGTYQASLRANIWDRMISGLPNYVNSYFMVYRNFNGNFQGRQLNGNICLLSIDGFQINGSCENVKRAYTNSNSARTISNLANYLWLNYGDFRLNTPRLSGEIKFNAPVSLREYAFNGLSNITKINISGIIQNTPFLQSAFNGLNSVKEISVKFSKFNSSHPVYNFYRMFGYATNLTDIDISGISTGFNPVDMTSAFVTCSNLVNLTWDYSSRVMFSGVNRASFCFSGCSNLRGEIFLTPIMLNTSEFYFGACFQRCNNLQRGRIVIDSMMSRSSINIIDLDSAFLGSNIRNIDCEIYAQDTSNLYLTCSSLFDSANCDNLNVIFRINNIVENECFAYLFSNTNCYYSNITIDYSGTSANSPNLRSARFRNLRADTCNLNLYGNLNLTLLFNGFFETDRKIPDLRINTNADITSNIITNYNILHLNLVFNKSDNSGKYNNICYNTFAGHFKLSVPKFNWNINDPYTIGVYNSYNILLESNSNEQQNIARPFRYLNADKFMLNFNINCRNANVYLEEKDNICNVINITINCKTLDCCNFRANDPNVRVANINANLNNGMDLFNNCLVLNTINLRLNYTNDDTSNWVYWRAFNNCSNLRAFRVYYNANWMQFNNWRNTFNSQISLPNKAVIQYIPY